MSPKRFDCVEAFVQFRHGVKIARCEMPASIEGPMIGHLNDPGAARTSRRVEELYLPENEQEDFLHQVFCLGAVAHYPIGDGAHHARVAPEEECQRVVTTFSKLFEKVFIGENIAYCCGMALLGPGRTLPLEPICFGRIDDAVRGDWEKRGSFRIHIISLSPTFARQVPQAL